MYEEFESVWVTEPKRHIGNEFFVGRITVAELYRSGWWITEIFGTYATVISKSQYHVRHNSYDHGRPYFCCKQCRIDVSALTPQIMRQIQKIRSAQWKKYKHIMLGTRKYTNDRRNCKKA